jgi:thiamine transport system permease protein
MTVLAECDRLTWTGLGLASLALVVVLVLAALAAMLAAGGTAPSLPPADYLLSILRFTAWQAFLSSLLSVVLAMPVALAMARRPVFFGRGLVLQLMALPLGLPVIVAAFALLGIWGRRGVMNMIGLDLGLIDQPVSIYGLSGILLAHVFFNLPLAARLMLQALERVPREHWQIAASLNMGRLSLFRFVEWPALREVLAGIAALIFMLCATSFTLVLTLGGGPQATTLEVAIYQSLKLDFDPSRAVVLAFLQIGLSLLAYLVLSRLVSKQGSPTPSTRSLVRLDGASTGSKIRDVAIIGLFVLFVLTPLAEVLVSGLAADLVRLTGNSLFLRALSTSLILSLASGLLASLLTLSILEARHALLGEGPTGGPAAWLAGMLALVPAFTLLVPSLALATGWFLIVQPSGLVERAGPWVVVAINMLMALPFTLRVIEPALASHHRNNDRLAASLGISGTARIRMLDWPCLKAPLMAAFSFAMALSLGDLGAIAIFGSDHFITLPSLLHAKLGSYRSDDAAGIALTLAVMALVLSWPASRLETAESRPL